MGDEPTPTPLTDAEREAAADLINDALLDDGHSGFACDPARPLDYTAESVLDRLLASDWFAARAAAARADVVAAMQQTIDELWATCESLSNELAAARADERERLARLVERYDRQGYLFPCADVAWWLRSRDALAQPAEPRDIPPVVHAETDVQP